MKVMMTAGMLPLLLAEVAASTSKVPSAPRSLPCAFLRVVGVPVVRVCSSSATRSAPLCDSSRYRRQQYCHRNIIAGIFSSSSGESDDVAEEAGEEDTVRVRIWRALANGEELSMSQLSNAVGERRRGELRAHLVHVEKQAKTLNNKSDEWRIRRGLAPAGDSGKKKIRLKMRKGAKNEFFIKLL